MSSMNSKLLLSYFPAITALQLEKLEQYHFHLSEWNKKINLISENDLSDFTLKHLLPSLSVLKCMKLHDGMNVLDVGTGGGLPGIPLAIMLNQLNFMLIDSTGKKVNAVTDIAEKLNLKNVKVLKRRGEDLTGKFHLILTRAALKINDSIVWLRKLVDNEGSSFFKSRIIYFKGGNLNDELKNIKYRFKILHLSNYYQEDYFNEKMLVCF